MIAANSPRIILHIGAPKTASTYIQRRFRANADRLRQSGIYVPVLPQFAEMAGNAKLLSIALSQRRSLTFQREFPKIDIHSLNAAQIVTDLLHDWRSDSESVILSDENLRPKHARLLRELLPLTAPCVVVLFVRRQDRWLDSYFNQMIKTNEIREDMSGFLAKILDRSDERLCQPDWFAHYSAWRDAFENCQIVFYDEVASDVFRAFFSAAGFESVPGLIDVDRAQVSLNLHELAYLLEPKSPFDYPAFLRRKSAAEQASARLSVHDNRSVLNNSDLARLRAEFAESNRQLLAVLGRAEANSQLQLDDTANPTSYCSLPDFYASDDYQRYRKVADAIYARRNRRDRIKSFFARSNRQ